MFNNRWIHRIVDSSRQLQGAGYNGTGSSEFLGIDGNSVYESPIDITTRIGTPLTNVDFICSGYDSSACIIDGEVWVWGGLNMYAEWGHPNIEKPDTPCPVPGLTSFKTLRAGWQHYVGLRENGEVWTWGRNDDGQLGGGSTSSSGYAQPVTALSHEEIVHIGVGRVNGFAVTADGRVYGWGSNVNHVLSSSDPGKIFSSPVLIQGLEDVVEVYSAYGAHIALTKWGEIYIWGTNLQGLFGEGSDDQTLERPEPEISPILTEVKQIAVLGNGFLCLTDDGNVWAWGRNDYSQAGADRSHQTYVTSPNKIQNEDWDYLTDIVQISGAYRSAYALDADGTVWGWGWNSFYALGAGYSGDVAELAQDMIGSEFVHQLANTDLPLITGEGPQTHTLSTSAHPEEGGTVTPSGTTEHLESNPVDLQAVPSMNPRHRFLHWSGTISETDNPYSLSMTQDHSVIANFLAQYQLVYNSTPGGGIISVDPDESYYDSGTFVTITATPDPDYVFEGWSGDLSGDEPSVQVQVNSDMTFAGSFRQGIHYGQVVLMGHGTLRACLRPLLSANPAFDGSGNLIIHLRPMVPKKGIAVLTGAGNLIVHLRPMVPKKGIAVLTGEGRLSIKPATLNGSGDLFALQRSNRLESYVYDTEILTHILQERYFDISALFLVSFPGVEGIILPTGAVLPRRYRGPVESEKENRMYLTAQYDLRDLRHRILHLQEQYASLEQGLTFGNDTATGIYNIQLPGK